MNTRWLSVWFGIFAVSLLSATSPICSAAMSGKSPAIKWGLYQNSALNFKMKMPKTWQVLEKGNAVGFTSPVKEGAFGAIGVMKSTQKGLTIALAAKNDFNALGRKGTWTQTSAKLSGYPAIKVVATPKNDPTRKLIQYYVQAGADLFLIQCIAPTPQWNDYSALFSTMIRTLQFIPTN